MRNNKRQATRKALAELGHHLTQLAIGIFLALALVVWILTAGERPSLMVTILVAAIASGLISSPVDRAFQAFWHSRTRTLANTTDALWAPDWPEATEERRYIRQWRRRSRRVYVIGSGLFWALVSGAITFMLAHPEDQWQHDPAIGTALIPLVLALPVGIIGFIAGAFITHKLSSDWQR